MKAKIDGLKKAEKLIIGSAKQKWYAKQRSKRFNRRFGLND